MKKVISNAAVPRIGLVMAFWISTHRSVQSTMNIRQLLLTASFAAAAITNCVPASAEEAKAPGSGPNPFSDCGIGAALFSETKWAAVTSNVIWDVGTTAVTSATMSPQTCNGKKVQAALFIRDTYDRLAEETAAGHGEHLTTALTMFGCSAGQHTAAAERVRQRMGTAVTSPSYAEQPALDKAAHFYSIIETAAANTCAA
jgi:hypothetical protein